MSNNFKIVVVINEILIELFKNYQFCRFNELVLLRKVIFYEEVQWI